MNESVPPKQRNARACEACRASKSRCVFKDNDQTVCQKCEVTGYPCVVRLKARPMRSRSVRPLSNATKPISPRVDDSDFSLDLPSTPAPNSIKDVNELHNHHKHVFGDEDTEIKLAATEERPRLIEHRRLNLHQAEQLLQNYRQKSTFFPFVTIPPDATVPTLSRNSPFLLLAILTAAASHNPPLRHQLDQEFRRILSSKVVVEGQKSLDYLQGMLVYICWYPFHSKPKNNQAFMYLNLAISLVAELGLDRDQVPDTDFNSINRHDLVENGRFTPAAKRAYLGAYYVSSASVSKLIFVSPKSSRLSESFARSNQLDYRDMIGQTQGMCFLDEEEQVDVRALVNIHRLMERISIVHSKKLEGSEDLGFGLSPDLNVQIFNNELDEWRRITPDSVRNLPHIALVERFVALTIYSIELGFLLKPYRTHLPAITSAASQTHLSACLSACKAFFEHLLALPEMLYLDFGALQWSLMIQAVLVLSRLTFLMASTRHWTAGTARSTVPLSMYLDALCYRFQALSSTPSLDSTKAPRNPDVMYVFKMVLASVKKSYEGRVAKIVPEVSVGVGHGGHCPILDPSLRGFLDREADEYEYDSYGEGSWGDGIGSTPVSDEQYLPGPGVGSGLVLEGGAGDVDLMMSGGVPTQIYFDVWNTMTCNWAEEGV